MDNPIKVCFVGLNTYSLFNPKTTYKFGGAEVRSYLLSKGLSRLDNYDLNYVVGGHVQVSRKVVDNITIVPHTMKLSPLWFDRLHADNQNQPKSTLKYKVSVLQMKLYRLYEKLFEKLPESIFKPRLKIYKHTILYNRFQVYDDINADVYCALMVSDLSSEVAAYCKETGKKFILFIAGDMDLSKNYQADSRDRNIYGSHHDMCYFAIQNADKIIVQTEHQAQLLKDRFDRESSIITSPIDFEDRYYLERKTALWIGRTDSNKQPGVLIKLAHQFPKIDFVMIMNRYDEKYSQDIIDTAPPNVTIHEFVPYHDVETLFADAFVFINTSNHEGFPNTFLQAGKYAVPILSLHVDPDNFITNHRCGIVAQGDYNKLSEGLQRIYSDKALAQSYSQNVYTYVEQNHNLSRKVAQLDDIIKKDL